MNRGAIRLLLGVQGCGKSLCAKVVASAWRMPLLRMDPGVLYQKFIGESEARLREALQQAESMAPVVLWIDEIEKAFASASSDSAEGFSGAEIEQAIVSGLFAAFAENKDCSTEHIMAAIRATQPISVVMREHVVRLRTWAQGRCVMAD